MNEITGPIATSARQSRALLPDQAASFDTRQGNRADTAGYGARAMFAVLRRHRALTVGCILTVTFAAAVIALLLTPRFQAEALVVLDTRRPEIMQQSTILTNLVNGSPADAAVVRGEVAQITSSGYARTVIERLDLMNNAGFRGEMALDSEGDPVTRAVRLVRAEVSKLLGVPYVPPVKPEIAQAIETLKRRLSVFNDDRSYALTLRYESANPEFAAMVVNELGRFYVADQVATKQGAARRASGWLSDRLGELKAQMAAAERKVAEFQAANNLDTVIAGTLTEQRLHELNLQYMAATNDLAQKQASLQQVRDQIKATGGATSAAPVLSSPVIQALREREADASQRAAALQGAYRSAYPGGEPRLRDIDRNIAAETQRIIAGLSGEVAAGQARTADLATAIQQEQAKLDQVNAARVKLSALQHEAASAGALYDSLLQRWQQVEADGQSLQADMRFIPAEIPTDPSFPRKGLIVGFALVTSIFIGVLLAFFAEQLDDTPRNPEDAEALTGVPSLGVVPLVKRPALALAAIVNAPLSAYAEAINGLRISLCGQDTRVIAISSALPGEGKTMIAASLARGSALVGTKTLLIDCDLRRPRIAHMFRATAAPGLGAMFEQQAFSFARFVQKDDASGLHYLAGRRMRGNPQEILGSPWMAALIAAARCEYDLVVIDTPPLLNVSDARLMARLADTTLLAVRWGRTPGPLVTEAVRQLRLHGKAAAATVFSMANMRRYRLYRGGGKTAAYGQQHLTFGDAY